jgi:hypothetical protein
MGVLLQILSFSELPHIETIESRQGIITRHASIAIESMLPIKDDIECRHDDAYDPKGYMSTILEPDINQAEYRGEYIQPMFYQKSNHL